MFMGTKAMLGLLPAIDHTAISLGLTCLFAYPAWLLVTVIMGIVTVAVKRIFLGTLKDGDTEEDHAFALPLTRNLAAIIRVFSWLWPRPMRWRFSTWMGAKIHPHTVTDESFLDLAYADLFTREDGTFFSRLHLGACTD